MVVVLIPPPVDAGDAPINIKITIKNKVLSLNKVKSIVLYPAVLSVTDWNIEDKSDSKANDERKEKAKQNSDSADDYVQVLDTQI